MIKKKVWYFKIRVTGTTEMGILAITSMYDEHNEMQAWLMS